MSVVLRHGWLVVHRILLLRLDALAQQGQVLEQARELEQVREQGQELVLAQVQERVLAQVPEVLQEQVELWRRMVQELGQAQEELQELDKFELEQVLEGQQVLDKFEPVESRCVVERVLLVEHKFAVVLGPSMFVVVARVRSKFVVAESTIAASNSVGCIVEVENMSRIVGVAHRIVSTIVVVVNKIVSTIVVVGSKIASTIADCKKVASRIDRMIGHILSCHNQFHTIVDPHNFHSCHSC